LADQGSVLDDGHKVETDLGGGVAGGREGGREGGMEGGREEARCV